MNIDINNIDPKLLEEDDRIVAYLKGQMSTEEEQAFLKELENNLELKERAIITARLIKGLKYVGSEQDRAIQRVILASSKQDVESAAKIATQAKLDVPAASKVKFISLSKAAKWLSIAVCFIGIIWLGNTYITYRNTVALGNQYDDVFSSSEIVRGEAKGDGTSSEAEEKLQDLFSNVKESKNLDEVIHELTLCWEISTMETYNDYTDYSAEIGWNLAIAHLKNNDKKEAKAVLEKLISVSEDGSAVSAKAKELLEKL